MKKKIALLGDSIRMIGYGTKVPEMLGEDYEVFQPEDNCRFAKYTLRMLFDYKDHLKDCEVIHWNNGLWDVSDLFGDGKLFSTDEEYVENMLRDMDRENEKKRLQKEREEIENLHAFLESKGGKYGD